MVLNLPTLLTWTRVLAIPLLVAVFYLPLSVPAQNLVATALFVAAAITDWLDGWLARRWARPQPSAPSSIRSPTS